MQVISPGTNLASQGQLPALGTSPELLTIIVRPACACQYFKAYESATSTQIDHRADVAVLRVKCRHSLAFLVVDAGARVLQDSAIDWHWILALHISGLQMTKATPQHAHRGRRDWNSCEQIVNTLGKLVNT